jgi:hypothetical protein
MLEDHASSLFGKDGQGLFLPFPGTNLPPKQNGVRRRRLLLSGWALVAAPSTARPPKHSSIFNGDDVIDPGDDVQFRNRFDKSLDGERSVSAFQ